MRRHRKSAAALAVLASLSLVAVACGDDDDDGGSSDTQAGGTTDGSTSSEPTDTSGSGSSGGGDIMEGAAGGEFVDCGTFDESPPQHLDPALSTERDANQVIQQLYSGLTQVDYSGDEPEVVPDLAESYEPNEDATVWTFTIRDDIQFADGEKILPSTFKKSWERAAELGGDYSYLMTFIEGGQEMLDGKAKELSGVVADDENMTLEVTLTAPYSTFDAVAGFQLFYPVPKAAFEEGENFERTAMVGSGPYTMEQPPSRQAIVIVKNENWPGDHDGNTYDRRLDKITFRAFQSSSTAFNAFQAGECQSGHIEPAQAQLAEQRYATTTDVEIGGVYYFVFDQRDWVGGPENKLFRQAVAQAIDRDDIIQTVYSGARAPATGVTPPAIPGYDPDLCDYCTYDPEAAQEAFDEWKAAGNEQPEPLKIQYNAGDAEHAAVVDIVISNLEEIGIKAERDELDSETYFDQLSEGDCVFCRAGWIMDYPTYDNFMFDLFHTSALDGNNYGFSNKEFDKLVEDAKKETDEDTRNDLFHQAEQLLLNEHVAVVPITFYVGDYVYNPDEVATFPMTSGFDNEWTKIRLAE